MNLLIKLSVLLSALIFFITGITPFYAQTRGNVEGTRKYNVAPELKIKTAEGKEIALSSLKGKIVLLDFWASWCRPCRAENPNVVAAYQKYKNAAFKNAKGFEVFSVSLDQNKEAWLKAIKDDGLSWSNHGSDLVSPSPAAIKYGVQGIPAGFLLDGNGIIIALGSELRGEGLETILKTLLKENNN